MVRLNEMVVTALGQDGRDWTDDHREDSWGKQEGMGAGGVSLRLEGGAEYVYKDTVVYDGEKGAQKPSILPPHLKLDWGLRCN